MIVTTSSFGFVPTGGQPNEYGAPNVAEYGDNAIHDALIEGLNPNTGYWNGTNGIISSAAANDTSGNTSVVWVNNSVTQYSTFRGVAVNPGQSIITFDYATDIDLTGQISLDGFLAWNGTYISGGTSSLTGTPGPEFIDGNYVPQENPLTLDSFIAWNGQYLANLPSLNYVTMGPVQPAGAAAPVPEPATLALLSGAIASVLVFRRLGRLSARRRAKHSPTNAPPQRSNNTGTFHMSNAFPSRFGAILFALASLSFLASQANANIYLDVKVDPSDTGYTSPYVYNVTAADQDTPVTLDVYALVADATPSLTNDGYSTITGSLYIASSSLKGDIAVRQPEQCKCQRQFVNQGYKLHNDLRRSWAGG